MDSDYFDNGPDQETAKPGGGAMDGHDDDKEGMDDKPTFLVNSEVCPDMKPGDMLTLRVKAVHDKEYEVSYEPEEKEEHEEEPEPASMPGSSEGGGPPDSMMD